MGPCPVVQQLVYMDGSSSATGCWFIYNFEIIGNNLSESEESMNNYKMNIKSIKTYCLSTEELSATT